jgi:hypothetical protein
MFVVRVAMVVTEMRLQGRTGSYLRSVLNLLRV